MTFCIAEGLSIVLYALIAIYTFPSLDYYVMVRMEAACIPVCLIFPVFMTSFVYMLYSDRRMQNICFGALLIPAIAEGTAILSLCYLLGFDHAAEISRQFASPEGLIGTFDTKINHFYCFLTYNVFVGLGALYAVTLIVFCILTIIRYRYRPGDIVRFFFKGKPTERERAIVFMILLETVLVLIVMLLGSRYISSHVILGVLLMTTLSIVKYIIAYMEFYSDRQRLVSLYSLAHLTLDGQSANFPEIAEIQAQNKTDIRIEKFKELMEVDKIWEDENLTSDTVCRMLGIGKTTLSQLVNHHFGMNFRELVNLYRIEEAKTYMVDVPQAKQEEIAEHCGFKNAQYFNTQFKKIVGETPAVWRVGKRQTCVSHKEDIM